MARRLWSTAACTARGCWAECDVAQEPPAAAQPWCMQIPVRTSAQEVAKQVAEVMTALQKCKPATSRSRAPGAHPMFQVSLCMCVRL